MNSSNKKQDSNASSAFDQQPSDNLLLKCKNAIEELHKQVSQLTQEKDQKAQEISELAQQLEQSQQETIQLKTNNEFLQMEIKQLNQQNQQLQKKLDNNVLEQSIQQKQKQSQINYEERVVQLQQENNSLKQDNEQLKKDLINHNQLSEKWTNIIETVNEKVNSLDQENTSLRKDNIQFQEQIKDYQQKFEEYGKLEQENINNKKILQELQKVIQDRDKQIAEQTKENIVMQKKIQSLQQEVLESDGDHMNNNLKKELFAGSNYKQDQSSSNSNDVNFILKKLQLQVEKSSLDIEKFRKEKEILKFKLEQKEQELNDFNKMHGTNKNYNQILANYESEKERQEQLIKEQNDIIQKYERQINILKQSTLSPAKTEQIKRDYEKQIEMLNNKNLQLTQQVDQFKSELKDIQQEVEMEVKNEEIKQLDLINLVKSKEEEINELNQEIHKLHSSLEKHNQQQQFQNNQYESLLQDKEKYDQKLKQKEQFISTLTNELEELKVRNYQSSTDYNDKINQLTKQLKRERTSQSTDRAKLEELQQKVSTIENFQTKEFQTLQQEIDNRRSELYMLKKKYDKETTRINQQMQTNKTQRSVSRQQSHEKTTKRPTKEQSKKSLFEETRELNAGSKKQSTIKLQANLLQNYEIEDKAAKQKKLKKQYSENQIGQQMKVHKKHRHHEIDKNTVQIRQDTNYSQQQLQTEQDDQNQVTHKQNTIEDTSSHQLDRFRNIISKLENKLNILSSELKQEKNDY